MKAICPHCQVENTGNTGDLIRCSDCEKVFEAGDESDKFKKKAQEVGRAKELQAKKKAISEKKRTKEEADRIKSRTKECPFCVEVVHEKATICRHCHSHLDFDERRLNSDLKKAEKQSGIGLAFFFMFVGYILILLGVVVAALLNFATGISIVVSGFNTVLISYVATATIKTAYYTKMIASKHN